ncbi:MAG: biotin transporter BioY [Candidatus Cellulosilyticum pullistercoris]|uniref:Biotin transporter n=1 Tax=Candidatus Cellulosilyticum pullistercoris TaxID=2838521 RepID=A0A9E2NKX9_9FIRM|nr:biotin transporter BioY [Candidatus Cellulosilyticum pullistercoris]
MNTIIQQTSSARKLTVKDIAYISLFTALIAICSWISIPTTVPFTMQTFAIFVAVGALGIRRGTLSIMIYLLLGAIGVPVFAGFSAGLGVLIGNTGGYLIGFVFSAIVTGTIIYYFGNKFWVMLLAMILGLVVCYIFGTAWFIYFYARTSGAIGVMTALTWCVFPFIIPDIMKIVLAIVVVKRVEKNVKL